MSKIAGIQSILGVLADGAWGPKSQAAFDALIHPETISTDPDVHSVKASSFADPADVSAFRRCKANGGSDNDCFKVGDNGIGCWGDDVTTDVPACALPPEDMIEKFGSTAAAHNAKVLVTANSQSVTCFLRDRMPHRAIITNGCGIDLAPAACAALGLRQPVMVHATWQWV